MENIAAHRTDGGLSASANLSVNTGPMANANPMANAGDTAVSRVGEILVNTGLSTGTGLMANINPMATADPTANVPTGTARPVREGGHAEEAGMAVKDVAISEKDVSNLPEGLSGKGNLYLMKGTVTA